MSPPLQGESLPRPKLAPFAKLTHEQLAIPRPLRGEIADGTKLTRHEKLVLMALDRFTRGGRVPCTASNLQIADAIGDTGKDACRRRQIQYALYGRKRKKDGVTKVYPGLCDPSRGFVESRSAEPGKLRELTLTPKWLAWATVRVFESSNGATNAPSLEPPAVDQTLAIAEVSTVPLADDRPPALVGPLFAPASAIAKLTHGSVEQSKPVPGAPIAAGPTPARAIEPSAEVKNRVLGSTIRNLMDHAIFLVALLRARGVDFKLGDDGKVKPVRLSANAELPSDDETAVLSWLKPEVVEVLKPAAEKSKPPPKAGEPPGQPRAPQGLEPGGDQGDDR